MHLRTRLAAAAVLILVAVAPGLGLDGPEGDGKKGAKAPSAETLRRRKLRWELADTELLRYDFLKGDWQPGASGGGDRPGGHNPKRWTVTENSLHVDYVDSPDALDCNWSLPPATILTGQPFRMRLAASVKGPKFTGLLISPYVFMAAFVVRVVPAGGKLPALEPDAPLRLKTETPPDKPWIKSTGPGCIQVSVSGEKDSKSPSEGEVEVELQLQDQIDEDAYLFVNGGVGAVLFHYHRSPVEGLPDTSRTVWLDRDYGYPGANAMLVGRDLKIGETYTVSYGGHTLFSRNVPTEIQDVVLEEEVTPRGGYRSFAQKLAKRPNQRGEIPPHEWVFIPTTEAPGTSNVVVECSKSGRFELPFKVLPVKAKEERRNLDAVVELYKQRVPENLALIRALTQPGRLRDFVGKGATVLGSFGSVNNVVFSGDLEAYCCGGYQGQVLGFLNFLRFNDRVRLRRLVDGLEFGPFQASCRTHHFAAIWPTHASDAEANLARWQETAVILDPWIEQRPMAYPVASYVAAHFGVQPDNNGPGGGVYYAGAYPVTGGPEYQDPFTVNDTYRFRDPLARRILIACPVAAVVTDAAGKRLGLLPDGSPVAELEGSYYFTTDASGERVHAFCLPEGRYAVEVAGTAAGRVGIAIGAAGGPRVFEPFAIAPGARAALAVPASGDAALTLPDGSVLRSAPLAITVLLEWSVTLAGAPRGVEVSLTPKAGAPAETARRGTDARGVARFAGVLPGEYALEYAARDGKPRRIDVTVKVGDAGVEPKW